MFVERAGRHLGDVPNATAVEEKSDFDGLICKMSDAIPMLQIFEDP